MGSDPEAHLMYGYYLGGPESGWKIQGLGEWGALETSWYADGDDFYEAIKLKLLEAEKPLNVKVRFTGAESGMDYTIYAIGSHHRVEWGAKPVSPTIPDGADLYLAKACIHLGITPVQPEPSWVLGALYF